MCNNNSKMGSGKFGLNDKKDKVNATEVKQFSVKEKCRKLQKKLKKVTYPDYYTNACCSHPLYIDDKPEDVITAARRRLNHELGIPLDQLMRCVLGADMGHAALQEMVALVRAGGEADAAGAGLARGAVFYTNMALWGARRVLTLHASYLAVLPAFLKALAGRHPVVTYEVVVALQNLVTRVPQELHEVTWDLLLDIVRAVLQQDKSFDPPNELIHDRVHELITSIEQLHETGQYYGDPEALLDLVDSCGHDRPEASTMRLITARCAALGGGEAGAALALAERYVRLEPRLGVRLHALAELLAYIKRHRCTHGEELSERVGGAVAAACALDADVAVRAAAARALPELAKMCTSDACIDLIDQLEKMRRDTSYW